MKNLRSYRFSELCQKQVSWLRGRLNMASDTAVHELAISELFDRKQIQYREFLFPQGKDFDLIIGKTKVARVSKELVAALPHDYLDRDETERGSLFSALMLTLAQKGKGTMRVDKDALASLWRAPSPTKAKPRK